MEMIFRGQKPNLLSTTVFVQVTKEVNSVVARLASGGINRQARPV
jgi:hypothetical protein